MNKKVIEIVRKYVEEHLDKSDQKLEYWLPFVDPKDK